MGRNGNIGTLGTKEQLEHSVWREPEGKVEALLSRYGPRRRHHDSTAGPSPGPEVVPILARLLPDWYWYGIGWKGKGNGNGNGLDWSQFDWSELN